MASCIVEKNRNAMTLNRLALVRGAVAHFFAKKTVAYAMIGLTVLYFAFHWTSSLF